MIVIDRDFLNHDQTGCGESMLFNKGIRDAVSMDDAIEHHLVDSSFKSLKRTFTLVPYVCLYLMEKRI